MEPIIYRIDQDDRLTYVNQAWCDFARANDGGAVMPDRILGRNFWDFIGGDAVRDVYQRLVKVARTGRTVRVPFRCDSSEHRRQMEMVVEPLGNGEVQITSRILEEERRAPIPLFDSSVPRSHALLRVCSWCHSVADSAGRWMPLETAVVELRLLDRSSLPGVTHGICPACAQRIFALTLGDNAAKPASRSPAGA